MLKLNFLLVLRQLKKDKKTFFINLLGTSFGFTAIILMSLYISYENNYDAFNENSENLFRVERTVNDKSQSQIFDSTPYELAKELKSSFPEIGNAVGARTVSNYLSVRDEIFPRNEGLITDSNFLSMFSFDFLEGDKNTALSQPMSIVLSKSLADKLFPNGAAIGKTVYLNKKHNFTVTGVFADYRKDSHMTMEYMISYSSYEGVYGIKPEKGWAESYVATYIQVKHKDQVDELSKKIEKTLANHVEEQEGTTELLSLRPITDIYLKTLDVRSDAMGGIRNNVIVIYLFIAVAFFTGFITTVNYINLTTTQLVNRELEIGMKKVLGISKGQLRYQFIIESLLMVFGVIIVSSILVSSILPLFSLVVDRKLSLGFSGNWLFFLKVFVIIVSLGLLSGLYPVIYLSSLKINSILQGITSIKRRTFLRKGLVLFQLLIAFPLIFLSVFIISQINYLNNKDTGFDKQDVLLAWIKTPNPEDRELLKVIKDKLLQNPNVIDYSISTGAPFFASGDEIKLNWEGAEANDKILMSSYSVDYDFQRTYKLAMVKGRWFSEDFSTDAQNSCVINETAAKLLGWDNPIGKTLDDGRLKVIGVVKDFNQFSLFQKIPPMMLSMNIEDLAYSLVSIKTRGGDRTDTQKFINETFNTNFIDVPVDFRFLDVGFDEGFMTALQNVMKIFILFSVISILLVIIGLYSLIAFSLTMQKKMIAIRKVLGASTKSLFLLILKEYMILYSIALGISLVLTYFTVIQVSKVFAYSVGIQWINFLSVIIMTLFIVLFTICGKIWSTSKEHPLNSISRS
ncbi:MULTISPECIES: ABC transporter permease [Flavobacterium]|uniref:ABC transporter permease n=1 Tax=Flavobacterium TaxID=237 RepID=UPI00211468D3|nr:MULTISPECIES: ABC transporter permease [Flavobacterium]UUF16682.1 ABC transporter permease [Flavobacterium panici]